MNITYRSTATTLTIEFGKGRYVTIREHADGHLTAALTTAFGRCAIDELPQDKKAAKVYCEDFIRAEFAR
jgi:hypothetical protein